MGKKIIFIVIVLCTYQVCAQSSRDGMGSTPYADAIGTGVIFRVWAPNASTVFVTGSFNGWNTSQYPLVSEGTNGLWSIDIPGNLDGATYKYIINNTLWRVDPRAKALENNTGPENSIILYPNNFDWENDSYIPPPDNKLLIYEMHIGTYNDVEPNDGQRGTFSSAIERLSHIRDMGFTAVEVLPVNEFPTSTSWGYNPIYPYAIERQYGTPDEFKAFIKACHTNNLGVIIDVVFNHWGQDDKTGWDMWQFDGWNEQGYGGIYFYNEDVVCCTPWGPRPDYDRYEVREYIKDNLRMWVDEYHVDGFRWDAPKHIIFDENYNYIPGGITLLEEAVEMIQTEHTNQIHILEDLRGITGFDAYWDVGWPSRVISVLAAESDDDRNMASIVQALEPDENFEQVTFIESHDVVGNLNNGIRFPSRITPDNPSSYWARKRSALGAALMFTKQGIPMIFQGQEMLESEPFNDTLPIDWSKTNTFKRTTQLYKDLISLRKNERHISPGLLGDITQVLLEDNINKIVVWKRAQINNPDGEVLVIANFSNGAYQNHSIAFPSLGTWHTHLNSDSLQYSDDFLNFGSTLVNVTNKSLEARISIAPYSFIIMSKIPSDSLVAEQHHFDDTNFGNSNTSIDINETIEQTVILRNTGTSTASNVIVNLSSELPGITITHHTSSYLSIPPFQTATNTQLFSYKVDDPTNCGSEIPFVLIVQFNDQVITNYFTEQIGTRYTHSETTNSFLSSNTPVSIIDNQTISSELAITQTHTSYVQNIEAYVRLDHTWVGDLTISLVAPDGTEVILAKQLGIDGDNYGSGTCGLDVQWSVFDDNASNSIITASVPFIGTYMPQEALNAFIDQQVSGTWTLKINDNYSADQGTLRCWGLTITETQQDYTCLDASNEPPQLVEETWNLLQNTSSNLQFAVTDTEGDLITLTLASPPSHGLLTTPISTNHSSIYTPIHGFIGTDTFNLIASDASGSTSSQRVMTVIVNPLPDTDSDGMPDLWELEHAGHATTMLPSTDTDGDGLLNVEEFYAGTDPTNALSVLKIDDFNVNTNTLYICWPGQANVRYRLQKDTNLMPQSFFDLPRPLADEMSQDELWLPAPPERRSYYRIQVLNE